MVVDGSRNDEERDAVIGLDRRWNLLYVVYIERENDMIRLISARKATRKEREYYETVIKKLLLQKMKVFLSLELTTQLAMRII